MKHSSRNLLLLLVSVITALVLVGPAAAHVRSDGGGAGLSPQLGEGAGGQVVQLGEGAGGHVAQLGDGTSTSSRATVSDDDRGLATLVAATVLVLGVASIVVVRRRRSPLL
ncbi:MAG: hypothetical protein M3229_00775 [Actinomycetota bacterium]|nr:hypothetical protein [Actinomycetota bacterium]